jgi:hypothetical protein
MEAYGSHLFTTERIDKFDWLDLNLDNQGDTDPRLLQLIRFRAYFYDQLSMLKRDPGIHDYDLSRLKIPPNPRNAWKLGIRVVRNLLRGKVPNDVHEVIFCVMTAHALQEETSCYSFTQEEYVTIIDPHELLTNEQRFFRDLCRWSDELEGIEDIKLFESVSNLLFGEKLGSLRRDRHCDNLSHFQELFQNLLSDTEVDVHNFDWLDGTPLSVIQARYAEATKTGVDVS